MTRNRFIEIDHARLAYLLRLVRENEDEIIVTTNHDGSGVKLVDLDIEDPEAYGSAVAEIVALGRLPQDNCMECHPNRCNRCVFCRCHHDGPCAAAREAHGDRQFIEGRA